MLRIGRALALTLIAGTVGGAAVLAAEAMLARSRRYVGPELGLTLRAAVGPADALPLRLVLLGDSTALGVGVDRVADTVGGRLAHMLTGVDSSNVWDAAAASRPGGTVRRVLLSSVGVSGSRSTDLATQVARCLLGDGPDVAVILIGVNDVLGLRRPTDAAACLAGAVRRLREAGVRVVVGTCPDLGAARAFARPLRQVAGWQGRRMARAQASAAAKAGATVVDLAAATGAAFRADAGALCRDRFHPSAAGYRMWAQAMLPAVTNAAASREPLH
ncbi:SGNH/GDSL hydrolase family protein [Pilimelia columellifera]|uniref:SGNH hydrolase-type esterase domain-containing protein n=1 Tax=Pilimelia columellifera subsp. columellifera TaxID=706583 RepID=A0ABP6AVN0_9ACTN